MKILHCPTDTGGNPWGLSRAERRLGLHSEVMIFRFSPYKYPTDINLHVNKIISPLRELKRYKFFQTAVKEYDIFHYNFGKSILDYPYLMLNYLDLPILKKRRKKIFFTLQGCDARLKTFCMKNFSISACIECKTIHCRFVPDFIKRRRIQKIECYADKIYALNPDLLYNYPEAEFLPYASVNLEEWRPHFNAKNENKVFNIVHLPTNRGIKGTKYLLDAVKRLLKEGYALKLSIIEKFPRNQLKEIYQKADIVVDQLLIGWYGTVAVEAMACGTPVICYIREKDLQFIPQQMVQDLPIINTQPSTIYSVLKEIVENREILRPLHEKSRIFVEKWHDPLKIAKKVIKDYQDAASLGI